MSKPFTPVTVPGRIGSDVYIRDSDDATVQMKALVYSVDFTAQTADVGFYPERDSARFSQIHLPAIYRASGVPLSELSLEPHAGAAQKGYADLLRLAGVPESELAWMDSVGTVHSYTTQDDEPPGPDLDVPLGLRRLSDAETAVLSRGLTKQPLFTRAEVVNKIKQLEDTFEGHLHLLRIDAESHTVEKAALVARITVVSKVFSEQLDHLRVMAEGT